MVLTSEIKQCSNCGHAIYLGPPLISFILPGQKPSNNTWYHVAGNESCPMKAEPL